jgi:ADP-ribose pyrophosphatase
MRTVLHYGRFLDLVDVDTWEFVERRNCAGVVVIVPITRGGEIVLVEQFRPALQKRIIELPAGLVGDDHDADEDPSIAARRELVEETGYDTDEPLVRLTEGPTSSGLTSETVIFFHARNVEKTGHGGGVGGEEIEVHVVPMDGIREWLKSRDDGSTLVDPKVYAGLWLVAEHSDSDVRPA